MADETSQPNPETPAPPPAAATPPPAAPGGKPAGRSNKPFEKRKPRGDGGPKRRIPSLDSDMDYKLKTAPNVRDLDAEIADELEAALKDMDAKSVYGADDTRRERDRVAAQGEHGKKKGTVVSIHGPDVFIEIPGGRGQGVLAMENFPDGPPKIGTELEIAIEGYDPENGLLILSRKGGAAVHADWSTVSEGMVVEARVLESNKGGLSVDVNGIRGFMPISQIDRVRVEDTAQFVNQKLICLVTEVDKEARNLVVSRRAVLEKEREELREKLWAELQEGQIRTGIIGNVRDFGAFVDLGGVDGLLHVSEISWKRIPDATQVLTVGQMIKVVILKIDRETRKLALGLKQLEANPWDNIQLKYVAGYVIAGKVTRLMDFGAFVELEPGVEGLIHISELARNKVWRVKDVVSEGQDVQVKIMSVDSEARRISLSLREALAPEPVKSEDEEEEVDTTPEKPEKPRVRNYELKGGMGGPVLIPEKPE